MQQFLKQPQANSNPIFRSMQLMNGNWFERLFGFTESNSETVYRELEVVDNRLRSINSGEEWICGKLEIASLEDLRNRIQILPKSTGQLKLTEYVGDAKSLHQDPANAGALFQVASQFNLLEMTSPSVRPEHGITIYEHDRTQGPTCAIACAAGTVYRNYFVDVDGQPGQTASKQVDCLAAIGDALGNTHGRLWTMQNGYALPSEDGLAEVDGALGKMSEQELDQLRAKLWIGLQWQTEVTLAGCNQLVSQAYCSALPIGYSDCSPKLWKRFATLVLEASYEATLSAAVINAAATGNNCLFLTLVGGGVFANNEGWILNAIRRACKLHRNFDLDVKIVSFRSSNPAVREMSTEFQQDTDRAQF